MSLMEPIHSKVISTGAINRRIRALNALTEAPDADPVELDEARHEVARNLGGGLKSITAEAERIGLTAEALMADVQLYIDDYHGQYDQPWVRFFAEHPRRLTPSILICTYERLHRLRRDVLAA